MSSYKNKQQHILTHKCNLMTLQIIMQFVPLKVGWLDAVHVRRWRKMISSTDSHSLALSQKVICLATGTWHQDYCSLKLNIWDEQLRYMLIKVQCAHASIKFMHLTFERWSCMDQDRHLFQTHSQQSCWQPCSDDKFCYASSDSGMWPYLWLWHEECEKARLHDDIILHKIMSSCAQTILLPLYSSYLKSLLRMSYLCQNSGIANFSSHFTCTCPLWYCIHKHVRKMQKH